MNDLSPAPTRAEVQLQLAQMEGPGGSQKGTAEWLASGMKVQESQ